MGDGTDNEDKVQTDTTPEKDDKEAKRLARALSNLQKELAEKTKEFEAYKKQVDEASMSEVEKLQKQLSTFQKEATEKAREAESFRKAAERSNLVSKLVAEHKLRTPEFGAVVLEAWDQETDFDTFVADFKKKEAYAPLFQQEAAPAVGDSAEEDGEEEEDIYGDAQYLSAPSPVRPRKRGSAKEVSESDKALAKQLYRNDPNKQKAFLENLKRVSQGEI